MLNRWNFLKTGFYEGIMIGRYRRSQLQWRRALSTSARCSEFVGRRWPAAALLAAVAIAVLVACGGGSSEPPPVPISTPTAPPATPQGATAPAGAELQIAFAVSDLSVGANRIAFGLVDRDSGPLRNAQVQVSTFFLTQGGQEGPIETVSGVFRRWPVGAGGVYTAQVSFDRPGTWGIGVLAIDADGSVRDTSARVEVRDESLSPALGSPAPRSLNKTVRDVEKLEEMTTDTDPDPDLYAKTIAEALDTGRPLVVSFATPAFCQTATCGPQLDVVKELKQRYQDRVNFIHVEVFDNPLEIQGDLRRGRVAEAVTEWSLPTEPWTFIIDRDGLVSAKFEGFTTREELEPALVGVLE